MIRHVLNRPMFFHFFHGLVEVVHGAILSEAFGPCQEDGQDQGIEGHQDDGQKIPGQSAEAKQFLQMELESAWNLIRYIWEICGR